MTWKDNTVPFEVSLANIEAVEKHLAELEKSDRFDPYTVHILNHAIKLLEVFKENQINSEEINK